MDSHLDKSKFISLRDHPFPRRFRYMAIEEEKEATISNHNSSIDIDHEIEKVSHTERNHFSHPHNLLTYSLRASDSIRCYFCETIISGLAYGCKKCKHFLHEACSEFPQVIEHLSHPGHELTLRHTHSTPTKTPFTCKACHVGDNPALLFNFHYGCEMCPDFTLHMGCTSMPTKVIHKDINFSISYSNPLVNEAGPLLCDLCNHSINMETDHSWVYYDHAHNFITHFGCLADILYKKSGKDDDAFIVAVKNGLTNLDGNEYTSIVQNQVKKDKRFFHRHALKLLDDNVVIKNARNCGICGLDLSTDKKKGCTHDCDFVIHDRCSQLPLKIQHPFHPHPLNLVPKIQQQVNNECIGCCQTTPYTVIYQCKTCEGFKLHPSCAACPRKLKKLDLTLYYSFPYKNEISMLFCNYCSKVIKKNQWLYYGASKDDERHITCQLAVGVSNCYVTLRDLEVE